MGQLSLEVLAGSTGQREAGVYRYLLWRAWGSGSRALFVMLNPSTATDVDDDPTIRRCRGFARAWGFDGIEVVNLFALRSTDPAALYAYPDPVGPLNDRVISDAAKRAGRVVCAWGGHGGHLGRGAAVLALLRAAGAQSWCFGLTKTGQPQHPLYRPRWRPLEPMPNGTEP